MLCWHDLSPQEYLTADWLNHHPDPGGLFARLDDPDQAGRWREVIRLYAGLSGDAPAMVERLLPTDPLLAAGCLADAAAADGALLRLLHGALPATGPAQRGRMLALLETLDHPLCQVPAGPLSDGQRRRRLAARTPGA